MRLFPRSIRWRLHLWHGLLLAAVLCGFGWTMHRLEWTQELRRVDAELQQRLNTLLGALGRPPGPEGRPPLGHPREESLEDFFPLPQDEPRPPPRQERHFETLRRWVQAGQQQQQPRWFIAWSRNGGIIHSEGTGEMKRPKPDTRHMEPLSPHGSTLPISGEAPIRELMVVTPPGDVVLVGRSMKAESALSRRSAWRLAGFGSLVWLAGVAGGGWLTARALRPIQTITETATRISAGHLDRPINIHETDTELGRMAGVLNDTFARLHQSFDQQARFTADAAHELRTPVTVILSQTQLALNRERTPEEYQNNLRICQRAAERMRGLIESLLSLAQLDAEVARLEMAPLDLAHVAEECAQLIGSLVEERGMTLRTDLQPALCLGDSCSLAQIITNLLNNAVQHSPPAGIIHLHTGTHEDGAWLSVADHGPGVPQEHRAHLFDRFYRVEASRNRDSGGAGLGLAICKAIADAHGARLRLEDTEGGGCTFLLTMPPTQAAMPRSGAKAAHHTRRLTLF